MKLNVAICLLSLASLGFGSCDTDPTTSIEDGASSWDSVEDEVPESGVEAECAPVASLSCGERVSGDTSDFNSGSTDVIDGWPVAVGNFAGPEIAYSFVALATETVEVRFIDPAPSVLNHDIFVIEAQNDVCASSSSVARGFNDLAFEVVAGRSYFIVIDGADGAEGAFELEIGCSGAALDSLPPTPEVECDGDKVTGAAADALLSLTQVTGAETLYSTYDRIDAIASIFESCEDTRGLFPTTYRHITARIIEAIEDGEIKDGDWGRGIVVDFAGRFLRNLRAELTGKTPSYVWDHYYALAGSDDVSRTRTVVVAMTAHLTLDLPYALVAVGTTEEHEDDYFVLGELMIEIVPDFVDDLRLYYDTDAEDLLDGFFLGEWVDGAFGEDTMITLNYQTVRTKAWNSRWLLEQWWGGPVADGEIYSAFWAIDGILASLDAAGAI